MNSRYVLAILLLFVATKAISQQVYIAGTIRERDTKEAIPGASVALLGSGHGAKANREGTFRLALEQHSPSRIRITAIGYRPDTLTVALFADSAFDIFLTPLPLEGSA